MKMAQDGEITTSLIACEVFKSALDSLQLERRCPQVRVVYLPCNLHLWPQKLSENLLKEITYAKAVSQKVVCLYGDCFPDIHGMCAAQGALKVPGPHCYGIFLGGEQYARIIEETAGTYFLEKELALNFDEYCKEPLELDDEEMRREYFRQTPEGWWIDQAVVKKVRFQKKNLLAEPFDKGFDLIVCRNVIIYFSDTVRDALFHKFHDSLKNSGMLFLGSSEVILRPREANFQMVAPSFYRREKAPEPSLSMV